MLSAQLATDAVDARGFQLVGQESQNRAWSSRLDVSCRLRHFDVGPCRSPEEGDEQR
jgi:hypothetical protein